MLAHAVAQLERSLYPPSSSADLTSAEAEALTGAGFDLNTRDRGSDDPLLKTTVDYAALLATSKSVAEVAVMLDVNESRVRQRLGEGTIYGFKVRHRWMIPEFIFEGDDLLPSVEEVLPHVSRDLHPIAICRWFTTPSPDLLAADERVSPRDWLRRGGEPEPVAEIAHNL